VCQRIESDSCFDQESTIIAAKVYFDFLSQAPVFGYGGKEYTRSMEHYRNGLGGILFYDHNWYLSEDYTKRHINTLYNWFVENYGNESYGPLAEGPIHCARVFVGRPNTNNDVFFTLGRHHIEGCFQKIGGGQIRANFFIPDTFDFDPGLCTVMPQLGGFNPIGCIPHRWWWKLAQKGIMSDFSQVIKWQEAKSLTTDFSDRVNMSNLPGCGYDDANVGTNNFCPIITELR
jgi:hypothetical protein